MKKIGLFLVAACTLAAFSSCNKDSGDYPAYANFVTVRTLDGANDYYFELDGTTTTKSIYPGDRSRIGSFTPTDGKRALIYFNLLETKKEPYTYNAAIYDIITAYTGASRIIDTQQELDELKDDPMDIRSAECTRNYINILATFRVSDLAAHKFNLIRNNVPAANAVEDEAGYYTVELRHDIGSDTSGNIQQCYLSFDLTALQAELAGKTGLLIRVNSLTTGKHETVKVSLPKQ